MIIERLNALRALMKQEGMQGYYIPTSDYHSSEYLGEYFKTRVYMSGFTGSAGTLVVLPDEAGLWTDARYFLQAERQLSGSGVTLFRMGEPGVPTITEYLSASLPEGAVLGMDGRTLPAASGAQLKAALSARKITLATEKDLVAQLWQDRPPMSKAPAWLLEQKYAGRSAADKLSELREDMAKLCCDLHVIATLDDVAWLFNLRGDDIENTPVALAYAVVGKNEAFLCIDPDKLDEAAAAKLKAEGVSLLPYAGVYDPSLYAGKKVLLESGKVNLYLYELVKKAAATLLDKPNPTALHKATKNPVELENLRHAHVLDGLAVTRTMRYLKENIGKLPLTELDIAEFVDARRAEQGAISPSFDTISAYSDHAAIMHYTATKQSNAALQPKGFLLLDSGGQYLFGTTDVTRTMACGKLTEEEKRHFATVLKSMLNLSAARFLEGCSGLNLDILARQPFWAQGEDFKHGTGHGVGYLLGVHEGPNAFRWKTTPGRDEGTTLAEGMVTSNEPGYYEDGVYGIRTENEVVCRKGELTPYGQFMYLETLTLVPIDLDAVDAQYLGAEDIARLNAYHKEVYERLSPHMTQQEREWLSHCTRAI